jgi:hypothetical protein
VIFAGTAVLAHEQGWLEGTPLSIAPAVRFDFSEFNPDFSEEAMRSRFDAIDWQCQAQSSNLGHRVCTGRIRSWNGVYVRRGAFFFDGGGRLQAMQLTYRTFVQEQMADRLARRYGQAQALAPKTDRFGQPVVSWALGEGVLVLTEEVEPQYDGTALWLARQSLVPEVFKRWLDRLLNAETGAP